MNILFVANAYLTYNYFNFLDILTGEQVGTVFILFENASGIVYGKNHTPCRYPVIVTKTVERIIHKVDMIIVLKDKSIPNHCIEGIRKISTESVRFIVVNIEEETERSGNTKFCAGRDKPMLCLLGDGNVSCLPKAELTAICALSKQKFHISSFLSPITVKFIEILEKHGCKCLPFLKPADDVFDLEVVSIRGDFFDYSIDGLQTSEFLLKYHPHSSILLLSNQIRAYDENEIKKYFLYRYNVVIGDIVTNSFRSISPGISRAEAVYIFDSETNYPALEEQVTVAVTDFISCNSIPDTIQMVI